MFARAAPDAHAGVDHAAEVGFDDHVVSVASTQDVVAAQATIGAEVHESCQLEAVDVTAVEYA